MKRACERPPFPVTVEDTYAWVQAAAGWDAEDAGILRVNKVKGRTLRIATKEDYRCMDLKWGPILDLLRAIADHS